MKVRMLDNTIRLRLDRAEVDQMGAGRQVVGSTEFPGGETFAIPWSQPMLPALPSFVMVLSES